MKTTFKRPTRFLFYYRTKCCYGLSMDLLDNIATELGFEFHLYIVRDQLFGSKRRNVKDFIHNHKQATSSTTSSSSSNDKKITDGRNDGHKSTNLNEQQPHHHHQPYQQQQSQQQHQENGQQHQHQYRDGVNGDGKFLLIFISSQSQKKKLNYTCENM